MAGPADEELGLSHLGDGEICLPVSWKLAYPGAILKAANLPLRGVVGLCRDGDAGGASEVVFLTPAAWPPPADKSPQGGGQFGFTTPLSPQSVPRGQEKRKRLEDFLLGPGMLEPRQVGAGSKGEGQSGACLASGHSPK